MHFVIQNREAVDGRGFGAQDEPAKSDGQGAVSFDRLCFGGSEIALGADPDTNRPRHSAALRMKIAEVLTGRAAAGFQ